MRTTVDGAGRIVLLLVSMITACGDDDSDESRSGVAGAKRLEDLTQSERVKLCDYTASRLGGYGESLECDGEVVLEGTPNQAECVMGLEGPCRATVADAEACLEDTSCSNQLPASCIPLFQCGRAVEDDGPADDDMSDDGI